MQWYGIIGILIFFFLVATGRIWLVWCIAFTVLGLWLIFRGGNLLDWITGIPLGIGCLIFAHHFYLSKDDEDTYSDRGPPTGYPD